MDAMLITGPAKSTATKLAMRKGLLWALRVNYFLCVAAVIFILGLPPNTRAADWAGGISAAAKALADIEAQKELQRYQYELESEREKRQIEMHRQLILEQEDREKRQRIQLEQERQAIKAERKKLELEKLEARYPDWNKIVSTQEFSMWLNKQSPEIQRLWKSDKAEDAISLLNIYKTARSDKQ